MTKRPRFLVARSIGVAACSIGVVALILAIIARNPLFVGIDLSFLAADVVLTVFIYGLE